MTTQSNSSFNLQIIGKLVIPKEGFMRIEKKSGKGS